MNVKPVFILVFALLLLTVPALIWLLARPDVPAEAARPDETSDLATVPDPMLEILRDLGLDDVGEPSREPDRNRGDIFALVARLETLERKVQQLDRTSDLHDLRARLTALERSARINQTTVASSSASSRRGTDLSQTKRELSTLSRSHSQLASRVSDLETNAFRPRTGLAAVERRLMSLENNVRRLDSR